MADILYLRVSTKDQSIQSQLQAFKNKSFDKVFTDEGVSGAVSALNRDGFSDCFNYSREGDSLTVYSVDRLGRDARDIIKTIDALRAKQVEITIANIGITIKPDSNAITDMIIGIFSSMAQMERERIRDRQALGISNAKEKGKHLGAKKKADYDDVFEYRKTHTVAETAKHFRLSESSVKRIQAIVKSKS